MSAPVELLAQLERMTAEFANRASEVDGEELVRFVERREEVIAQLKKMDLSRSDKAACRAAVSRILQYDPPIRARMEQLHREAGEKLGQFRSARMQKNVYEKAYPLDSLFFDKKK